LKLEINDPFELLYSTNVQELQNGCILVTINTMNGYVCEHFPLTEMYHCDTMHFFDEDTSFQTCSVKLTIYEKNVNTLYRRFCEYTGNYEYLFVPYEQFE
jgi:hypothetical protein